ncbi:hypothetical protein B6J65_28265, partial [Klebsiella quasipneumoniae]|uniref:hypothetical protein n=1 Tax=Klebsiella pneumoniae complex TaxID=3390273 RepID=UPI000CBBD096
TLQQCPDAGISQQQASGGALVFHGVMSPVLVASILFHATKTRDKKRQGKGRVVSFSEDGCTERQKPTAL